MRASADLLNARTCSSRSDLVAGVAVLRKKFLQEFGATRAYLGTTGLYSRVAASRQFLRESGGDRSLPLVGKARKIETNSDRSFLR